MRKRAERESVVQRRSCTPYWLLFVPGHRPLGKRSLTDPAEKTAEAVIGEVPWHEAAARKAWKSMDAVVVDRVPQRSTWEPTP